MSEFVTALLVLLAVAAARRRKQSPEEISLLRGTDRPEPTTLPGKLDRNFDNLVAQTGLGITPTQGLGIMALSAVILGGAPILWRTDWLLAALGVLAGILVPLAIFAMCRIQYRWKVQNQLPDAFFTMARSLRAGQNIEQSMATVAQYGTQPLAGEFKRVVDQTELGLAVPVAIRGMAKRIDLPDFNSLVTAVSLHRNVGGNLAQLLDRVATAARDRTLFRGYFRAATALARVTAFVIALAPIILLIVYAVWQPDFIERFTSSVLGMRLLLTAAVLEVVGIIWMLSLLRVEY